MVKDKTRGSMGVEKCLQFLVSLSLRCKAIRKRFFPHGWDLKLLLFYMALLLLLSFFADIILG